MLPGLCLIVVQVQNWQCLVSDGWMVLDCSTGSASSRMLPGLCLIVVITSLINWYDDGDGDGDRDGESDGHGDRDRNGDGDREGDVMIVTIIITVIITAVFFGPSHQPGA